MILFHPRQDSPPEFKTVVGALWAQITFCSVAVLPMFTHKAPQSAYIFRQKNRCEPRLHRGCREFESLTAHRLLSPFSMTWRQAPPMRRWLAGESRAQRAAWLVLSYLASVGTGLHMRDPSPTRRCSGLPASGPFRMDQPAIPGILFRYSDGGIWGDYFNALGNAAV